MKKDEEEPYIDGRRTSSHARGRPKGPPKVITKVRYVKLTQRAGDLVAIAAGYTRETMAEYVCRVVSAQAVADIDEAHAAYKASLEGAAELPNGNGTKKQVDVDAT
jgi:hypothetical protein